MSLIKQLWIAIAVVMALSLGGSLVVSTLSARDYLEHQLRVKDMDNATSLALSMSQMAKDPVLVELQLAAQFDAGHYRLIRLTDPGGAVLAERVYEGGPSGAPEWFMRLAPIETRPGVSHVQDGWRQFGTLTVESHARYAYEALWRGTLQLLTWFLLSGVLAGLVGTLLLKHITRPLGRVVAQAEAIGARRFVTTPEPSTMEFRSLARAMNALSERVRAMLADESTRLEQLRRQSQHDEITGLTNRSQFLNVLDSALSRDDTHASGVLLIARLGDLAELNRSLGRAAIDRLLREIGARMSTVAGAHEDWEAGRLNGSDFALLAPGASDAEALLANLTSALHPALDALPHPAAIRLPMSATPYAAAEPRSRVLARVDGGLAAAEQRGERAAVLAPTGEAAPAYPDLTDWRAALTAALDDAGVRLGRFPVLTSDGRRLHDEAPVRLMLGGKWQGAGYFMPWAARLGLMSRLDAAVVRVALAEIDANRTTLGINLSAESLCDAAFRAELLALLQGAPEAARRLWLEVPEYGALRHIAEFRALCLALRPLGCKLGIEHAGPRFGERLAELHDLGLDYVKIDASVVRGIDRDAGNQSFLRGLCTIAHSIGLVVIAEGVTSDAESACLLAQGVDGVTGPAVRLAATEQ